MLSMLSYHVEAGCFCFVLPVFFHRKLQDPRSHCPDFKIEAFLSEVAVSPHPKALECEFQQCLQNIGK